MIPEHDSFIARFGEWLLAQPEANDDRGVAVVDLMNLISNTVHLLRQTFKATEVPHLLSFIAYRAEQIIRDQGGIYLYGEDGTRFRVPLAEELDTESPLIEMLYSMMPDDLSGLEGD